MMEAIQSYVDRVKPQRGLFWLAVAIAGAVVIGRLESWGFDSYTARWLGACFKVASGGWGGYRIARGVLGIDPSTCTDATGFALLHLARAILVGAAIIGVCLAI